MPKGVFQRKKKDVPVETVANEPAKAVVIPEPVVSAPVVAKKCGPPHLPQCQCQDKLGIDQVYFEDGSTGTHVIGDNTKNEIYVRWANGGKGGLVNRKR